MSSDPFEEPLTTFRWACEEIDKFDSTAQAFVDNYKPELFRELDLGTGQTIVGYYLREKLPDEVRKAAYRAIIDLRNSLDQAVHAAALTLGTRYPHKTNFPLGDTSAHFVGQLAGPNYKGIPVELHRKLMSFHPYWETAKDPDGDTILRSLLETANPNKHRIPVKPWIATNDIKVRKARNIRAIELKWLSEKKFELFRTPYRARHELDADIKISVSFTAGTFVKGKAVGVMLHLWKAKVRDLIDEIAAETDAILAARGL